jgi:hypothetical protein
VTENQDNLKPLFNLLETLLKRQDILLGEVNMLKAEIYRLKQTEY